MRQSAKKIRHLFRAMWTWSSPVLMAVCFWLVWRFNKQSPSLWLQGTSSTLLDDSCLRYKAPPFSISFYITYRCWNWLLWFELHRLECHKENMSRFFSHTSCHVLYSCMIYNSHFTEYVFVYVAKSEITLAMSDQSNSIDEEIYLERRLRHLPMSPVPA